MPMKSSKIPILRHTVAPAASVCRSCRCANVGGRLVWYAKADVGANCAIEVSDDANWDAASNKKI